MSPRPAARQHADAAHEHPTAPIADVSSVTHADAAANDETATRRFALSSDPLFGMAFGSVFLLLIFAALIASF